jgi:hypothetical protein
MEKRVFRHKNDYFIDFWQKTKGDDQEDENIILLYMMLLQLVADLVLLMSYILSDVHS